MSDYIYTRDWFSWAPPAWRQLLPGLPARRRFLEIGSYEGRSTVWIVENMMEDGGEIVCIDTWQGAEEHVAAGVPMSMIEKHFDHNMDLLKQRHPDKRVLKRKATSLIGLAEANLRDQRDYDFIYIDGSHVAKDVLTDACLAWPLLKVGGVMVFDDYLWENHPDRLHRPETAIDVFAAIFAEDLVVVDRGYQLIVKKIR